MLINNKFRQIVLYVFLRWPQYKNECLAHVFCASVSLQALHAVHAPSTTRAILPTSLHNTFMNNMSIFHGLVCHPLAFATAARLQKKTRMMCVFYFTWSLLCQAMRCGAAIIIILLPPHHCLELPSLLPNHPPHVSPWPAQQSTGSPPSSTSCKSRTASARGHNRWRGNFKSTSSFKTGRDLDNHLIRSRVSR